MGSRACLRWGTLVGMSVAIAPAKLLVALSGGVDSAVAAALLVEAGHDVTAVHLKLADVAVTAAGQGCCTLDDAADARRTAQLLGIPFYVWDLGDMFRAEVQGPFATEYAAGRTPNPCVTCNEKVKYAALLERALNLGFDGLATGHHARLRTPDGAAVSRPTPGAQLHRAADHAKDQSYVLYVATTAQLAHTVLPVGEMTKAVVREEAARLGLRVASKPDSYDICFVPDGDTAGYLARHLPVVPGAIVDRNGVEVGRHDGIWHFTIGQRRGLNLGSHERRFVIDLDRATNTVVVGPREDLAVRHLEIESPTWTVEAPDLDRELHLQLRAHGAAMPARTTMSGAAVRITLDEPTHGVAVGQSAVVYDGDHCLGGGRISAVVRGLVPVSTAV